MKKTKERGSWSYVKEFIPYYKPYLGWFIADMLCALVATAVEIIFPLCVEVITDEAVELGYLVLSTVLKYAVILVAIRGIEVGCKYFIAKYGHVMGTKIESDLRRNMFARFQRLPHSFYDNQKVGALMSRITTDLFDITEFAHHCPEMLFMSSLRVMGIFTILAIKEWRMTLCLFVLLPFMAWIVVHFNNKWDENYQTNRKNMSEINAQVEDSLAGVRVVKSFCNEKIEEGKFAEGNRNFVKTKTKAYHYMGSFIACIRATEVAMYISILVLGAVFKINASLFVVYLLYAGTLLNSLVSLADYTEQFQKGITAFRRYQQIIDTPLEITDKEDAVELGVATGKIEFRDVTFRYNNTQRNVLDKLNLTINPGETVAIVGPSGGGKSTIANLIPRFYDVTEGEILVDGYNVKDLSMQSLRSNIGVVQQDVYLFWGSVYDNIEYGKIGADKDAVLKASQMAGVDQFIYTLKDGYDSMVGERGVKLSGGQKQRVSIARVFLKNPPILILDEATSALDNESEVKVQQSLDLLAKGRTSIIIAHRLSTIRKADKIIVLTDKGIVEAGTHTELLKNNGLYKKLYDLSVKTENLQMEVNMDVAQEIVIEK